MTLPFATGRFALELNERFKKSKSVEHHLRLCSGGVTPDAQFENDLNADRTGKSLGARLPLQLEVTPLSLSRSDRRDPNGTGSSELNRSNSLSIGSPHPIGKCSSEPVAPDTARKSSGGKTSPTDLGSPLQFHANRFDGNREQ
jgi:hypothetical protein